MPVCYIAGMSRVSFYFAYFAFSDAPGGREDVA